MNFDNILYKLSKSKFRSSFKLKEKDKLYIKEKGLETIEKHAYDFVEKRLIVNNPNDGKQTPFKGHPVFIAQHACGCCCRSCLFKWHKIPIDKELTDNDKKYIVTLLMKWIENEMKK